MWDLGKEFVWRNCIELFLRCFVFCDFFFIEFEGIKEDEGIDVCLGVRLVFFKFRWVFKNVLGVVFCFKLVKLEWLERGI